MRDGVTLWRAQRGFASKPAERVFDLTNREKSQRPAQLTLYENLRSRVDEGVDNGAS